MTEITQICVISVIAREHREQRSQPRGPERAAGREVLDRQHVGLTRPRRRRTSAERWASRAAHYAGRMTSRSRVLGVLVAAASLALTTVLLYPLEHVAPAVSLGVLYLLAVLLVSSVWGLWLGLATSVAAAAVYNFFHIPPTGEFTIAHTENWVALVVFLIAAAVASSLSHLARTRAEEAIRRRREADLAAELARLLLGSPEPRAALHTAAKRIADALEVDSAAIVLERVQQHRRQRQRSGCDENS